MVLAAREPTGRTLSGRYRLVARIAGGGMGEVYRGHDLLLDRPVAVKVLRPNLASDAALIQRFKQEARAAARLAHPNIVAVHDWGAADEDTYYMVMEFVSGGDLRELLSVHGRLQSAHAAEIVASVCDALTAAHTAGLVHRDVKPENVLIARGGRVKVADFGIAAVIDADRTQPGALVPGTLRYLSPEQAAGGDATKASDVWAAGALLAELLTGRAPGAGAGSEMLQRRALDPPVAPSLFVPGVPGSLDAVVLRACAIVPDWRFANAADMAHALRAAAADAPATVALEAVLTDATGEFVALDMEPTEVGASGRRRPRRRTAALVLVAALLAGGGAAASIVASRPFQAPALVGLTKERAAAVAEESGASLEVAGRTYSWVVARGRVVSQHPAPGETREDGAVEVVISLGRPPVPVPELVGLPLSVARMRIKARAADVGRIVGEHAPEPAGTVIAQTPESGDMQIGGVIDLVVSSGPLPVAVPDVTGLVPRKATALLEAAGFHVRLVDAYSDDVEPGRVVATAPSGGTAAPEGSEIQMYVSVGPKYDEVEMPDVRGMTVDAATAELQGLGLRVRVVQSCGGGGTIVSESDPISGTTIRENDLVVLFVC